MKRFILGIVWLALAGVGAADEPKADEVKKAAVAKALETFTGTWEIVAVQPDGATKDARKLMFNKGGGYAALDKDGKELWAGTFEIDPTTTPKVWDHRSHDAKKEGKDVLGIYELDGGRLRVACVVGGWKGKAWTGKPRPKAIDPEKADVVIELKRATQGK
jgi:uncharacterized protein (TIGR03067 family)